MQYTKYVTYGLIYVIWGKAGKYLQLGMYYMVNKF